MLSIAIQAGGQSRRMGQNKALIPLAGKPLIEHVVDRVEGLGDEILITTNKPWDYAYLGCRLVSDPIPGLGALVGLQTALTEAKGELVLVLACDMPFVNRDLLEHMITLGSQADAVVPKLESNYEPLHAVYNRNRCLPVLRSIVSRGEKSIQSLFPFLRMIEVGVLELERLDPERLSFFNINTPADLTQAGFLLAKSSLARD